MATLKQKRAIDNLVETRGSVSAAMRKAGYTDKSAKNPKNLTESAAWKELMEKYIPDDLLAKKHKELLNKKDLLGGIDVTAVSKGVEMGYKLKGKYAPDKVETTSTHAEEDRIALRELLREFRKKL